jgi:signal transduction histidine kinase
MGPLIYASIPIIVGFSLVCLVIGMLIGSLYWSRYYQQQHRAKFDAQLSKLNTQRQSAIGEVVRDLKHQLGNYLNIIKHRLAVMRGEMANLPPDQRDEWSRRLGASLDSISYYEWRMTQLIENIDFVARLENPDTVVSFSEVKPDAIVNDVVRDLYDRAEARQVELSWWARPEQFPRITANHDALRQALINMIDNSIKYAAPQNEEAVKGEVDISLSANGDHTISICVRDNGPGIPSDDLPRLFDKGYTTEQARGRRPKEGGMGYGLYIVKTVADRHQGWVTVESRVGQGTAITIILPVQRL